MAEPYLTRLAQIVGGVGPVRADGATLEYKHFFSGAAVYANGQIFASLSPPGLAVKLPVDARRGLVDDGKSKEAGD